MNYLFSLDYLDEKTHMIRFKLFLLIYIHIIMVIIY